MIRIPATSRRLAVLLALLVGLATLMPAATATGAATARSISISANPKVAPVRSVVVFTGTLTKSPLRSPVQLQRKVGARWVQVNSATTRSGGAYRLATVLPSTIGTYSYRTFAPARGNLRAATSVVVRIPALRKVTTTIKATPTSVPAGSSVKLSGTVRPYVAGTRVIIQKQVGASWTGISSTTVTRSGGYAKFVVTTTATTYRAFVARAGTNAPSYSIGVRVDTTPVIATTALPDATRKQAYVFKATAIGNPSGSWSATGLPTGLTMSTNGTIAGITEVPAGDFAVTLRFTRFGGAVAPPKTLDLTVLPTPPPVIKDLDLPDADLGKSYTATLDAEGAPEGTWSASGLPAGLTLEPSTGKITGVPQAAGLGDSEVTLGFTDEDGGVAEPVVVNIHVNPPTITTATISEPAFLTSYSQQINLSADVAGTWSLSGTPNSNGYSINGDGLISNPLPLSVPTSFTVTFTITGAPEGTPAVTRTYTFD